MAANCVVEHLDVVEYIRVDHVPGPKGPALDPLLPQRCGEPPLPSQLMRLMWRRRPYSASSFSRPGEGASMKPGRNYGKFGVNTLGDVMWDGVDQKQRLGESLRS